MLRSALVHQLNDDSVSSLELQFRGLTVVIKGIFANFGAVDEQLGFVIHGNTEGPAELRVGFNLGDRGECKQEIAKVR